MKPSLTTRICSRVPTLFAVAFLNSWNDREHAAALRASVPPPLPPGG